MALFGVAWYYLMLVIPGIGFVASSHGSEYDKNRDKYSLSKVISDGCVACQPGLTMINKDAVDPHGTDRFDSDILEDQGEYFYSTRPGFRQKQRNRVKDIIRAWPSRVTNIIHLAVSNDESDLLYENGHLIQLNQGGIREFINGSMEYKSKIRFYGHGHKYIYERSRGLIMNSVNLFIRTLLEFYSEFSHIETIYVCGAIEREHTTPELLILWQLFNSCLECRLREGVWPVRLVFIPMVEALYSCHQPWPYRSGEYKVHRSRHGYAAIYNQITKFILDSRV